MLSALLGTIQSSLGTPGFLVGSVFPIVLFAVVNGLLAVRAWPRFSAWLAAFEALSDKALLAVAIAAATLLAAYVVSVTASAVLEIFEGRRWPVSWFAAPLHRYELAKVRRLEARYWTCVHDRAAVRPAWVDELKSARQQGWAQTTCTYAGLPEVHEVRRDRDLGLPSPAALLAKASADLAVILQGNLATSKPTATVDQRRLDRDCDQLIEAIRFSRDRNQAERVRLYNLRKFRFPVDADADEEPSTIVLAPTALGNIARTIRSYAERHYQFDLDVLWTRLDQALKTSEPFYKCLQAAKVQVDFFVACSWLASLTTLTWLVLQLVVLRSVEDFLIIGAVGPFAALAAYGLACRSYGVFADVMRTGVDLFRFKVLTDLHLPLPLGLEEEKAAWLSLCNRMGYENLQGADDRSVSVTYRHPA